MSQKHFDILTLIPIDSILFWRCKNYYIFIESHAAFIITLLVKFMIASGQILNEWVFHSNSFLIASFELNPAIMSPSY